MQKRRLFQMQNVCVLSSLLLVCSEMPIFSLPVKAEEVCVRSKEGVTACSAFACVLKPNSQPKATVCGPVVSKGSRVGSSHSGSNQASSSQVKNGTLVFSLQTCSRESTLVQCDVLITNNGEDTEIKILDDYGDIGAKINVAGTGQEFKANTFKFGTMEGSSNVQSALVRGVPTKLSIIFKDLSSQVSSIALLQIQYVYMDNSVKNPNVRRKIQFRGISIR